MGNLSFMELALIFLAILLIFGAKRIPEIARGLGKGIREFKDATTDIKRELTIEEQRQQIAPPRPPHQSTAPRGYDQAYEPPPARPYEEEGAPRAYDAPPAPRPYDAPAEPDSAPHAGPSRNS